AISEIVSRRIEWGTSLCEEKSIKLASIESSLGRGPIARRWLRRCNDERRQTPRGGVRGGPGRGDSHGRWRPGKEGCAATAAAGSTPPAGDGAGGRTDLQAAVTRGACRSHWRRDAREWARGVRADGAGPGPQRSHRERAAVALLVHL